MWMSELALLLCFLFALGNQEILLLYLFYKIFDWFITTFMAGPAPLIKCVLNISIQIIKVNRIIGVLALTSTVLTNKGKCNSFSSYALSNDSEMTGFMLGAHFYLLMHLFTCSLIY